MEDFKKQDIKAIIDYFGKAGGVAYVDDIMENSGANRLRVYPILMEFYLEERLEVLEQTELGGFVKVRLMPSKA